MSEARVPGRAAEAAVHLRPPGHRRRARPHAAHAAGRSRAGRGANRLGLPRRPGDDGPAARPGEGQDPRRRHRLRHAAEPEIWHRGSMPCWMRSTPPMAAAGRTSPAAIRAGSGLAAGGDLAGRLVVGLLPEEPEARGLLALMLHCEARRAARRGPDGGFVPLSEQDVRLWSEPLIEEAEQPARAGRTRRADRPVPARGGDPVGARAARRDGPNRLAGDRDALRRPGAARPRPSAPLSAMPRPSQRPMGPHLGLRCCTRYPDRAGPDLPALLGLACPSPCPPRPTRGRCRRLWPGHRAHRGSRFASGRTRRDGLREAT